MKYLVHLITGLLVLTSCQIEDANAPAPTESFTKYYGGLTSYEAKDIEIIYDDTGEQVEGFVVFGTKLSDNGDTDYFVMHTDPSGILLDSVSFGLVGSENEIRGAGADDDEFRANESAGQLEIIRPGTIDVLPEGGYMVVGASSVTINLAEETINDWSYLTFALLDHNLDLVPVSPDSRLITFGSLYGAFAGMTVRNTDLDMKANDVIQLASGKVLIGGAVQSTTGGINFDNYFMKLDFSLNGTIVELSRSNGSPGAGQNEEVVRVFEKENGNIVAIGHGRKQSELGENGGATGINVFFAEYNPFLTSSSINAPYYGLDNPSNTETYDDFVTTAVRTPSGYLVGGTSITSVTNSSYGFVMSLSRNGVFLQGNSLPSVDFEGIQTRVNGVTQANDNDIVSVGQYPTFAGKSGEGMVMRLDQSVRSVAESNFGLADGNDAIQDAVTLPDGKIVAVANVDFGGGVRLISIIKLNDTGDLVN